jgi:hypothetical protein
VVQEAALAREIVFLCSEHEITYTTLRKAAAGSMGYLKFLTTEGNHVRVGTDSMYVLSVRELVQGHMTPAGPSTGVYQLGLISRWTVKHHNCRDRVFCHWDLFRVIDFEMSRKGFVSLPQ